MEEIISSINGFKSNYNCPKCQAENEISIFPYINFDENPEYYALVKNLDIFNIKCSKCNHEQVIQFDTLIVDPVHKYFLYLFCDETKVNAFKKNMDYFVNTVLNASEIEDWETINTRLVLNINSLIEKMAIFELGLNDKAIEFLKRGLFEKELVKSNKTELLFDGINQTNLEFIAYNETGDDLEKINVSIKFYNQIIETINKLPDENGNFELIDQNWVKSKIEN